MHKSRTWVCRSGLCDRILDTMLTQWAPVNCRMRLFKAFNRWEKVIQSEQGWKISDLPPVPEYPREEDTERKGMRGIAFHQFRWSRKENHLLEFLQVRHRWSFHLYDWLGPLIQSHFRRRFQSRNSRERLRASWLLFSVLRDFIGLLITENSINPQIVTSGEWPTKTLEISTVHGSVEWT